MSRGGIPPREVPVRTSVIKTHRHRNTDCCILKLIFIAIDAYRPSVGFGNRRFSTLAAAMRDACGGMRWPLVASGTDSVDAFLYY